MAPKTQTCLVHPLKSSIDRLSCDIARSQPIPPLISEHDVLVQVLAVGLNPHDHKNLTFFPEPGHGFGCDFCGIVVDDNKGAESPQHRRFPPGTRVCGGASPHFLGSLLRPGAFAQFVAMDERLLLRVPDS
ncbi:hypothetical protein HIM_05220 [Hirsutella minnesotensis 3608]|uniref:Alcohol dehydrogenase-like N-terminal domain-containing protein n=1 Tax=Hirsutella minnesotensis 3608 TaxID=1043627 RepID=A0A0F8A5G6_9HYPO|nr:hypothetical protein HIM_05220 [Hirsutella minnesotensis 3608]